MFFFSYKRTTWWYLVVVDGWLGCRLDVVLPSSPLPRWCFTVSTSTLGPALRLQQHEVAPRCWSSLSFHPIPFGIWVRVCWTSTWSAPFWSTHSFLSLKKCRRCIWAPLPSPRQSQVTTQHSCPTTRNRGRGKQYQKSFQSRLTDVTDGCPNACKSL